MLWIKYGIRLNSRKSLPGQSLTTNGSKIILKRYQIILMNSSNKKVTSLKLNIFNDHERVILTRLLEFKVELKTVIINKSSGEYEFQLKKPKKDLELANNILKAAKETYTELSHLEFVTQ
jgi:hypothetical protein